MTDLSSRTVLVIDAGLFLPLAFRLARDFGKVLFHSPMSKPFPCVGDAVIGDGFGEIEVVRDLFKHGMVEHDVVVIPDVGHSDLHYDCTGMNVWGSGDGDRLELDRQFLKDYQAEHGMDVPPYVKLKGLSALREHLTYNPDVYVKMSRYRGTMETFHSVNYKLSEPWLDELAVKLGPLQERVTFIVEDAIDAVAELGFDGFCIDGEFPKVAVQGIEAKDRGYIGVVTPYADLPEELRDVNAPLKPFLKENRYRNFFSTEVRITDKDEVFLTDPCCRHASPAGECLLELYGNLGEIIWEGAQGNLVEPEYTAKYAAQALIDHPDPGTEHWRLVDVPAEVRQWVKLYFACEVDGRQAIPPLAWNHETIGSVVGLGHTLEEAIDAVKEHAKALDGQGLTIRTDALGDVLKEMQEAEKAGVELTTDTVPEPSTVIQDHDA